MQKHFFTLLQKTAQEKSSRIIVGLDPVLEKLPSALLQDTNLDGAEKIFQYNRCLIDATANVAIAYKPQAAFYEQYGLEGLLALKKTLDYLKQKKLLSIIDAKRNDVSHTAQAYANAWIKEGAYFQSDAITLNGYLGIDSIKPFLDCDENAGIFILVKTSNESATDFQDLELKNGALAYEAMALLARQWADGTNRIGIVVGATQENTIEKIRSLVPTLPFLMPGIGAQGGKIETIKLADPNNQHLAFAAISRSICFPLNNDEQKETNWQQLLLEKAYHQAEQYRNQIEDCF